MQGYQSETYGGLCPAGFYCPAGTSSPGKNPCPPGTFNPSVGGGNINVCLPCVGGRVCMQYNLTQPDGFCDPGHYCISSATHSNPVGESWGDICPVGHICPGNTSFPEVCPDGTFITTIGGSECTICPAGSYCVNGSLILACPVGYYCPAGTGLDWSPCPSGTFNPNINVTSVDGCLPCPSGRFCQGLAISQFEGGSSGNCAAGYFCLEGVNTSMPTPPYFSGVGGECPEGFYCVEATSNPQPCPRGTYSDQLRLTSISECTACTPGMYCAETNLTTPSGLCDPGFVCSSEAVVPNPSGDDSTGFPCPNRHYCPAGTSIPLLCNAGEYNPIEGQAECFACPAGYYCTEGLLTFNNTRCPVGYYCPERTRHQSEYPCPPGTFGATDGLQMELDCSPCTPGHYCFGGRLSPDGECDAGWFCSRGAFSPQPFNFGLTNVTDVSCYCTNVRSGGQCQPGFYCPQGSDRPLPCPRGMYCGDVGLVSPSGECLQGFYCLSGASVPNPTDGLSGYPCPAGHFCGPGVTEPSPCPVGTYLNVTGANSSSDCTSCTAGSYCASEGLPYPSGPCQAGYYCPEGSVIPNDEAYICTPGHYCPEGSPTEVMCEGGTYENGFAAAVCRECPERYYCPFNSSRPLTEFFDCPAGFYCPLGTSSANQFGCPLGKYGTFSNRRSESECFSCPGGRYCGIEGLNSALGSGLCSVGYFCTLGSSLPNPTDGVTGDICPHGHYCVEGTRDPEPCPQGTYMPNFGAEDVSNCFPCPAGSYCENTGLADPTGSCAAGYFCLGGSSTPTPIDGIVGNTCEPGHFCPQGSSQSLPCSPGTYSSQPLASQCDICPSGHFCTDGFDPVDCPAGFYCPAGTGFDLRQCPAGTFSTQIGLSREELCTQCTPGYYCSDFNSTSVSGVCEAGYFCALGSNTPTPNGVDNTGDAGPCLEGQYCMLASSTPQLCPEGTFSNVTHLTNASECTPCPNGYYCGSAGLSSPTGLCSPGYYCVLRSSTGTPTANDERGGICPRGHYCPIGSVRPLGCDAGTHNPDVGRDRCFACLAGYYCPQNSTESELVCPVGHYCPEGTSYSQEFPCPAGYYNDLTQRRDISDCKACRPGSFCADSGLSAPSGSCDGGWYCTLAAPSSQPDDFVHGGECEPGFFCPNGSSSPRPCLAGYYCNESGLSEVSGPCYAGYFCADSATIPNPSDFVTGDICPCGHYCIEASPLPEPCPSGYYLNYTGNRNITDCVICDEGSYCQTDGLCEPTGLCSEGYYCPAGQSLFRPEDFICPPGYRCPAGSARPIACVPGFYQDAFGQSVCLACPEGYYCDGFTNNDTSCSFGISSPLPCLPGRYCPPQTEHANQFLCPIGTFSESIFLTNASQCSPCSPGHYCDAEGLASPTETCDSGYYCISGAESSQPLDGVTGDICRSGSYCVAGSSQPLSCPIGTFNAQFGSPDSTYCIACTGGYYCSDFGQDNTSSICSAGYYCSGGASTPTPIDGITGNFCPKGHHCPAGASIPIQCSHGQYTNETHSEICSICPAGFYCPGGGTIDPLVCPAGHYCQAETGGTPQRCPIGTFNPNTGLSREAECNDCTPGSFCDSPGLSAVSGLCEAGYYCPAGSISSTPSSNICPAGSYCPAGSGFPIECPPGTFSSATGLESFTECETCTGGQYCEGSGRSTPSGDCAARYFCISGSDSARPANGTEFNGPCPVGHFCPPATTHPIQCPAGSYNPIEKQEACLPCPDRYFCPLGSSNFTANPCPTGHYCPTETESNTQFPCPLGTYNPFTESRSVSACLPCSAGDYCGSEGLEMPSGQCSPGYFCSGFAQSPTPSLFDSILFSDDSNLICSNTSTGDICPAGTFCPLQSTTPTPCTPGYYCSDSGLSEVSGPCFAGHYCSGGSSQPNPVGETFGDVCPPGTYCEEGSLSPSLCAPGTFSPHSGNQNVSACIACASGSYCSSYGLASPTDFCPSGVYCPEGQFTPMGVSCPIGHFCPSESGLPLPCSSGMYQPFESQSSCLVCPAGRYCDINEAILTQTSGINLDTHGVVMPSVCPVGHYCPMGTNSSNEHPCPLGSFSNQTGLQDVSQCIACVPGYYCSDVGLTEPTGECFPGFVCSLGSASPSPDGSDSTGMPCPERSYCPEGTITPTPCPVGTYSSTTHLSNISECISCTPGKYCSAEGLIEPQGECLAGYFCSIRAVIPNPIGESYGDICPVGHYCQEGSKTPVPCSPGTYQPLLGQTNASSCVACDAGTFCLNPGQSAVTGNCSMGYFCSGGAYTSQPTDGITGDICPEGFFCEESSAFPTQCEPGTYSNSTGLNQCIECPVSQFCNNSVHPEPCLPGYYCPEGIGFDLRPCPIGMYNPVSAAANESYCLMCDLGMYCDFQGASSPTGNCSEGFYCSSGVDIPNPSGVHKGIGGICPPGTFCPDGTSSPISCPMGSYQQTAGASNCLICPSGYFCSIMTSNFEDNPCPTGHYCPDGTSYATQYPCPSGTYNNQTIGQNISSCLFCPPGMYCEGEALTEPTGSCSEGWYCSGGASSSTPISLTNFTSECTTEYTGGQCAAGTYCPSGSANPLECPMGMYCAMSELSQPTGNCSAGYWCDGGTSSAAPIDSACPAGHYCPVGTPSPVPCPSGTFAPNTGNSDDTDCLPCTPGSYCTEPGLSSEEGPCLEGYYCPSGTDTPSPDDYKCPVGHYCPTGSAQPLPCPQGQYQDELGTGLCKPCPPGHYCNAFEANNNTTIGVVVPTVCPEGYYCLKNTSFSTQYPCPEGTYSNVTQLESESQCIACVSGSYCFGLALTSPTSLCAAGFICSLGASLPNPNDGVTGSICPEGQYCPEGSFVGIDCPAGMFSNQTGLTEETDCQPCLPGSYCATPGLTEVTGPCFASHFCTGGAILPNPVNKTYGDQCTPGHKCPQGSAAPIPCSPGSYSPTIGNDNLSDCVSCDPGAYCALPGQVNYTGLCDPGYYCSGRTNTSRPSDGETGDICPEHHFCPEGSSAPLVCPAGTYMPNMGASQCLDCPSGLQCINGMSGFCTPGYYCPGSIGDTPLPCPPGTFSTLLNLTDVSECTSCPAGYFCQDLALTMPTGLCEAGYFCSSGVNTSEPAFAFTGIGGICPEGHSCPQGSGAPVPCVPGTYSNSTGQSECSICPEGFYCLASSTDFMSNICPVGHYCPHGTQFDTEYPCPAGTFNNHTAQTNEESCLPCPGGMYCENDGLAQPSGSCAPGWFCTSGSSSPMPLSPLNTTGIDVTCFFPDGNFTGGRCHPGTFCPEGSQYPRKCTPGEFCEDYGLDQTSGPCSSGYYCPGGVTEAEPSDFICPPGFYCPEMLSFPSPCPVGTFSNQSGLREESECESCTPGHFCDGLNLTAPTGRCDAGYFCPGGQSSSSPTEFICSIGHFCALASVVPQSCPPGYHQTTEGAESCDVCPEGYYCDPNEVSSCTFSYNDSVGVVVPTVCPQGYFCPNGTERRNEFLCLPGTFSNQTGLTSASECLACTPGSYCNIAGLVSPTGSCSQGYFCTEGAMVSNPADGGVTGDVCGVGQYCPEGSFQGIDCPRGTFNNQTGIWSENQCSPCSPGFFCDVARLSEPSGPCQAGHYCTLGATYASPINESFGDVCFEGHFCPVETSVPLPCPNGYYLNCTGREQLEDCLPCEPGTYCNDSGLAAPVGPCMEGFHCTIGANTSTPLDGITGDECPVGHFCPEGSTIPIACPDGTYMNRTQGSVCYTCPVRYYCTRQIAADACPPGRYCPAGTGSNPELCPAGTYNPGELLATEDECTSCDPGLYCQYSGLVVPLNDSLCSAGFFCTSGVNTPQPNVNNTGIGGICPVSHFCPEGSAVPIPCPSGMYNNETGAEECSVCPAGYFCLANVSTFEGSPCPAGHYCPNGTTYSTEFPCPPGTYNNLTGAQDSTSCLPCPSGLFCEGYGNQFPSGDCDAGWFCILGSNSSQPVLATDLSFVENCIVNVTSPAGGRCMPGTYCPQQSTCPVLCTAGMYCDTYELQQPTGLCYAGYYCEEGSKIPDQITCLSGHYCLNGTVVPYPCPIGHFSNATGNTDLSSCQLCTAGYFCDAEGLSNPSGPCNEGFYCPAGQNTSSPSDFMCPAGYHCPEGSSLPIGCPSGTYQDVVGESSCKLCPEGFYCDSFEASSTCNISGQGVVIPSECPEGSFCPPGTEYATQYLCPEGTFSNSVGLQNISECTPCSPSHYCEQTGLSQPSGECGAGYLCIQSSASPTPNDGVSGVQCPAGYFCLEGSLIASPCPRSAYSNATGLGSETECISCDPGLYCSAYNLTEPSGECFAGYYCILSSTQPNPIGKSYGDVCPSGHYCPKGTHTPFACPSGTFLERTRGESVNDCTSCTPGSYCEGDGLSAVSGNCSAGFYCFFGANTSTPTDGVTGDICPPGHFCREGVAIPRECDEGTYTNTMGSSQCTECPPGYFCLIETVEPELCPAGFYCPNGTGFNYLSCPRGTFSPHRGLRSEVQCTPCTGGNYCAYENATVVSGPCSSGFFCKEGVDMATPTDFHRGVGGLCPSGHHCLVGTAVPVGCPSGSYQDLTGEDSCKDCPAGYYCVANFTTFLETPCPPGHYCPNGTEYNSQFPCPVGTFNNHTLAQDIIDCQLCTPGKFCDEEGLVQPSGFCSPGHFCFLGSISSQPTSLDSENITFDMCPPYSSNQTGGICPVGHYCPVGSPVPTECSPGMFCSSEGLSEPTGNCSGGYYCPTGADRPDFLPCSPGYYCPEGSLYEVECPSGTFSGVFLNADVSNCESCTPGHYCEGRGLAVPTDICNDGYFCPGGQDSPTPISFVCSPGHFCQNGSSNQTGCPAGQYQPEWGQSHCLVCPEGYYCDPFELSCMLDFNFTIVCESQIGNDSLYISTRGVVTPTTCPAGSYCPLATQFATQFLCPPGTYSNVTGLTEEQQCSPCPPKMYCDSEGLSEPSGYCDAGYFCTMGANTSTPIDGVSGDICPKGYYCIEGSPVNGSPCPIGTFNNQTRLSIVTDCQDCTPGHYCPTAGLSEPFGTCAAGHFCLSGSQTSHPVELSVGSVCPAGHYCSVGTAMPEKCPPGTFLPNTGAVSLLDCIPCSAGFFCASSGQDNVTAECYEGYYCLGNASSPTPTDGVTGDICPVAHHCPVGSSLPLRCFSGTFMNHTGAAVCYECPEGSYCPPASFSPLSCPQGYYCPPGTGLDWQACPAGTFGSREGLSNEEECTPCPGGYYCAIPGSVNATGLCDAGYFCAAGSTTNTPTGLPEQGNASVCTAGHFCLEGSPLPIPCEAGTYSILTQQSSCITCPAGYYCPPQTIQFTVYPCPLGHYCPNGTTFAYEYPCPAGTYNPFDNAEDINSCLSCPPGLYCEGTGNTVPTGNCSEGYFCISGSHTSTPNPYDSVQLQNTTCVDAEIIGGRCYPGSFCPSGSDSPQPCSPGTYCSDYSLSFPSGLCSPGFYCPGGDISPQPDDTVCPTGHFCPEGSGNPLPCPVGFFLNTTRNMEELDCIPCLEGYVCDVDGISFPNVQCGAGFYCPAGQNNTNPSEFVCPVGHFCPLGSARPVGCSSGTYQDQTGQSNCIECPETYFCDALLATFFFSISGHGVVMPSVCPAGYYCQNGTEFATQYPCPSGTFSNTSGLGSTDECAPCPPGKVCSGVGLTEPDELCSAGYFCVRGAQTPTPVDGLSGDVCPEGHYCEVGSSMGVPCPAGTFSKSTSLQNISQCTPCTPGLYCPVLGLEAPVGPCSAGYFCSEGAIMPNPSSQLYGSHCPSGHFCPEGSAFPQLCPSGTFQPSTHTQNESQCLPCTPGYFCEENGLSDISGPCSPGFFCLEYATSPSPLDNNTGNICPVGHHCPNATVFPLQCDEGTYANTTSSSQCAECPPGYFCLVQTVEPELCPAGFYCPNRTGFNYLSCPRGTFSPHRGLRSEVQCTPCTGGNYCAYENATVVSGPCSSGFFCEEGVDMATPTDFHRGIGGVCPIGHHCPMGTAVPVGCPSGSYQGLTGEDSCKDCPAGYYCEANSTTFFDTPCPPGHYCPNGTEYNSQFPCPAGSYNPSNGSNDLGDCLPCLPSMYCPTDGLSTPAGFCEAGYYCFLGSVSPTPFAINITSVSSLYSDMCLTVGEASIGNVCPRGSFCPFGSSLPTPCPRGQYCDADGLNTPAGNCTAGFFCPEGSISPTQQHCTPGHYCPEGTPNEVECPTGTFSNATGISAVDYCLPCTAGYYCNVRGQTEPTGMCNEGYYCPKGQRDPTPPEFVCTPGHFCIEGSPDEVGCPPGTFQSLFGQSNCSKCSRGYYCDPFELNTNVYNLSNFQGISSPVICPPGHYCIAGTELSNQYPCPPGTYSNTTGLHNEDQCTDCTSGMYCEESGLTEPSGTCSAGYFCSLGASLSTPSDNITGGVCPTSRYCPQGSSIGELCPISTFNDHTGLSSQDECQPCSAGMFCSAPGLRQPTGRCTAGHYCRLGSPEPSPVNETYGYLCIAGHYCPQGVSSPEACPEGTFRDSEFGEAVDDCTPCLPGHYCASSGQDSVTAECYEGYYCLENASSPTPTDGVTGDICPVAHHCPVGSSLPLRCFSGTFMNHTGAAVCYECPEGSYCPPASFSPLSCPQGYYCPPGTGLDWQACPAGTFGSREGLSNEEECTPCTPGQFCDSSGLSAPSGACAPGYFCTLGVNTPAPNENHTGIGGICPIGHFCLSNSSHPIGCPPGTFAPLIQQSSCNVCPSGYYCEANSTSFMYSTCPSGHYCPEGTQYAIQYPCPPGTYNGLPGAQNESSCESCPPGQYCEGYGLSFPTGNCSAGYYCIQGSDSATPEVTVNGSLQLECLQVQLPLPGGICWPGTFCLSGSNLPQSCRAGHYCDGFGLEAPSGLCEAGYYCSGGNSVPNPFDTICPAGQFCPNGSSLPAPCPQGTFSASRGNPDESFCQLCTPGHFCSSTGLDSPEGDCDGGYFCPPGQDTPMPTDFVCPPGYYCPNGTDLPIACERGSYQPSWRQSECEDCPSGYFCDPINSTACINITAISLPGVVVPEICPVGSYCPENTEYNTQYLCPAGTFSNSTGLHNVSRVSWLSARHVLWRKWSINSKWALCTWLLLYFVFLYISTY